MKEKEETKVVPVSLNPDVDLVCWLQRSPGKKGRKLIKKGSFRPRERQ